MTTSIKTKRAYAALEKDVKDLLDAYNFLEILVAISDADTLLVAAKVLEGDDYTPGFPDVAAELAEAMRSHAAKPYAIKRAQKRRDDGVAPQC